MKWATAQVAQTLPQWMTLAWPDEKAFQFQWSRWPCESMALFTREIELVCSAAFLDWGQDSLASFFNIVKSELISTDL